MGTQGTIQVPAELNQVVEVCARVVAWVWIKLGKTLWFELLLLLLLLLSLILAASSRIRGTSRKTQRLPMPRCAYMDATLLASIGITE